jgi:hypothetical protein
MRILQIICDFEQTTLFSGEGYSLNSNFRVNFLVQFAMIYFSDYIQYGRWKRENNFTYLFGANVIFLL